MRFRDFPIQKKIRRIILYLNLLSMLFLLAIYLVNEYNEINERNDKTEIAIGKIFFDHQLPNDDSLNNIEIAEKIVGVLYANDHILTAYVFDNNGRLHTYYPDTLNRANLAFRRI